MRTRTQQQLVRVVLLLATLATTSLAAWAGELYGTIYEGTAKAGTGIKVEVICGSNAPVKAETNASGAYHLDLSSSGKCQLAIDYKGTKLATEVVVYDEGAQVDLVIETKDGKPTLRRK